MEAHWATLTKNWKGKFLQHKKTRPGDEKMTNLTVRIVKLPPMRVASVRAISEAPERDAWEKIRA